MTRSFLSLKRGIAAGSAVLVLGGAAVGIASAQTPTTTPTTTAPAGQGQARYQAFVDALAKRLGTTSAALQTAIGQARTDAGLPADGGFGPGRGGPGGPGGFGGPGGPGGPGGRGRLGHNLSAAAQAIGIPEAQLRQELSGKSLTDIATAHTKNPADVAAALENDAHARIDQAVTDGRLTADQATQQKQQVDQRIDQQMTEVMPQAPAGA